MADEIERHLFERRFPGDEERIRLLLGDKPMLPYEYAEKDYLPDLPRPHMPADIPGLLPEVGETLEQYLAHLEPAGRFTRSLIEPVDLATGLPNVDVAGPVMNAANIEKIMAKLQELGHAGNIGSAAEAAL